MKIVAISPAKSSEIDVDYYVPISIVFRAANEIPFYWRIKHGADSLLEVGIHPKTGELMSLTLTSINPKFIYSNSRLEKVSHISGSEEIGLPIFDLSRWSENPSDFGNNFYDEVKFLSLRIFPNSAKIEIGDNPNPTHWMCSNRISFGINDEKSLSVIKIDSLKLAEITLLKGNATAM